MDVCVGVCGGGGRILEWLPRACLAADEGGMQEEKNNNPGGKEREETDCPLSSHRLARLSLRAVARVCLIAKTHPCRHDSQIHLIIIVFLVYLAFYLLFIYSSVCLFI